MINVTSAAAGAQGTQSVDHPLAQSGVSAQQEQSTFDKLRGSSQAKLQQVQQQLQNARPANTSEQQLDQLQQRLTQVRTQLQEEQATASHTTGATGQQQHGVIRNQQQQLNQLQQRLTQLQQQHQQLSHIEGPTQGFSFSD